jgi:pimeloyl-ACP methyl ester carboxylesterase
MPTARPKLHSGAHLHKGCKLAYETRGSGPPVVFIQGLGIHGGAWKPQIDVLAAHYECLSFDNRGLGRSQPRACGPTIRQMAEDTLALMDAQGWRSAHIVGQSMGGVIALEIALRARERARSIALLCSLARGRNVFPVSREMLWRWLRTRVGTRHQRRQALLELAMPESALAAADAKVLAAELALLFGHDLAGHAPVSGRQLWALLRYDATARLGELAGLPALVVNASHDRIAPPHAGRAMAEAIPGARFVENRRRVACRRDPTRSAHQCTAAGTLAGVLNSFKRSETTCSIRLTAAGRIL